MLIVDSYYLAVTQGSVTSASTKVYIRWLESDVHNAARYTMSYGDVIDPNSIITEVKLQRVEKNCYVLPEKERLVVERRLRESVAGLASSENDDDDDDDSDKGHDDNSDSDTSGMCCVFLVTFSLVAYRVLECYHVDDTSLKHADIGRFYISIRWYLGSFDVFLSHA